MILITKMIIIGFGRPKSLFWHPKTAIFSDFGCKKLDFRCPKLRTETTFCRKLSPKMVDTAAFRRVFGKFQKLRISGSFLVDFPLYKPAIKNYGTLSQIKSLKSSNGCF